MLSGRVRIIVNTQIRRILNSKKNCFVALIETCLQI